MSSKLSIKYNENYFVETSVIINSLPCHLMLLMVLNGLNICNYLSFAKLSLILINKILVLSVITSWLHYLMEYLQDFSETHVTQISFVYVDIQCFHQKLGKQPNCQFNCDTLKGLNLLQTLLRYISSNLLRELPVEIFKGLTSQSL